MIHNHVCYHHDDGHTHVHTHAHTHDGVEHTHEHTHIHTHGDGEQAHTHSDAELVGHNHSHDCAHDCNACGGCDPKQETVALMQYMVNHNAAHTRELAELAKKLDELGDHAACEQVMNAVSEFEKGNLRLSSVLASLK